MRNIANIKKHLQYTPAT